MRLRESALSIAVLAVLTSTPDAQVIHRIVPEAASPGDLVIILGTGLASTSSADFTATVGGALGTITSSVTPLSVTATQVLALVPQFNAFVPPGGVPPSTPFGTVSLDTTSSSLVFFYMEGTFSQTSTLGIGTTQSNGARAVVSFHLPGGQPVPGNPNFALKLENVFPFSLFLFAVSRPFAPPFPMIGDGELTLDLAPIFVLQGPFVVDGQGEVNVALPIPPGVGFTVAAQWAGFDPASGALVISNGLRMEL